MPAKVTTSLRNWDFQEQHVQQNLVGGDFMGSHSVILCATVPRTSMLAQGGAALTNAVAQTGTEDMGTEVAIPIGVIDSANLQQDRQMAQIFEIGSKRSYILAARTTGVIQVNRVQYKGPSLLRMMYAYYPAEKLGFAAGDAENNILKDLADDAGTSLGPRPISMEGEDEALLPDIRTNPGYDNFFMNLSSDLFSQPHGLILYFKNNNNHDVGAVFLEECYIQNHGMGINANSIILAESSTIRFERIVPIKVRVVDRSNANGVARQTLNRGMAAMPGFPGLPQF